MHRPCDIWYAPFCLPAWMLMADELGLGAQSLENEGLGVSAPKSIRLGALGARCSGGVPANALSPKPSCNIKAFQHLPKRPSAPAPAVDRPYSPVWQAAEQ